jgi:hypothetical protein
MAARSDRWVLARQKRATAKRQLWWVDSQPPGRVETNMRQRSVFRPATSNHAKGECSGVVKLDRQDALFVEAARSLHHRGSGGVALAVVLAVAAGIWANNVRAESQTDKAQTWQPWEHTLHSTRAYSNPYADVALRVNYRGPQGQELRTYGFWDGDDIFRIRCPFPSAGLWRWRTTSEPADPGLDGLSGVVQVASYTGLNPLYRHGFLRASDDHHYLCHADGTPFLWIGDTAWAAPMRATEAEWDTYLQDRAAKRFSVVQIAVAPWWAGSQDVRNQSAFLGEHLERWNPPFWRTYERKITAANEHGIFVLIAGIMEPTTRYPEASEAIRFARQVAARFYGHFVAYSPSFDSGYRELGDAVGNALRGATAVHLITQHPGTPSGQTVNTIAETYFDRSYLDFAGDQTGHNGGNLERCSQQAISWNLHLSERRPPKPVVNLEAMYDTDSAGTRRPGAWRGEDARRLAYQSWLSGALGYTYGTDLYEWIRDPDKTGYWASTMTLTSSTEMKHLHDLLAKLPWWQLRPDHARVLEPPESFVKRPVFARTDSFNTGLAYLPTEAPIKLNLAGFPAKLRARWYNPRSGQFVSNGEERTPSGAELFTPPGAGDWVIVFGSGRDVSR